MTGAASVQQTLVEDACSTLAAMVSGTNRLEWGTSVSNPVTRHPLGHGAQAQRPDTLAGEAAPALARLGIADAPKTSHSSGRAVATPGIGRCSDSKSRVDNEGHG